MRKLISMLISISMIFAMLPTFVIAEGAQVLATYNSNANFSTSASDGTWDDGVWRAEYYNSSEDNYGTMSSVYDNGYAIDTWTWNQPVVFGDKLRGQNADTLVQHPVRTFIAPKKGTIKINAAEITQGTWSEIEYKIKHNDETKWTITSWNGGNISQPEQTLEVNKGDLIRFEVIMKATTTYGHDQSWTNNIEYVDPVKETTPTIEIDYENEKLTGFSDGSYTIGGATVTLESGELAVDSYMGTTIEIVKKGNGTTTIDSEEQSLQIPTRPTAPSVSAIDETSVGANDGKITGVTDAMEYKLSSAQEWMTVGSGLTELTNLAPGSYNVRYKATSSSFVSLSETVAINAQGVQEPIVTVPTLADTVYTDGMKLLNISLEGIQIPSGNTPGAFTWKTPNMLVNAGDNQSFDAVFTPTDTNNFKIKDLQIPVNIKPATITGITVTGYEGKADGTAYSITVTGTRAGDTVTYKVDSGEFTADAPSYTEVCEHSVTVKVSRANYNDFTQEVKIKITAAPTPEPTLEPTSEPTASPTTEPTIEPTKTTYISNEKFNTSTADGKWDGGIWSAMCYVQDWWIYSDLTNVADGKYNLEWLENGLARVDGNTLETDTTIKNFTVRAFTAPQKGILRIEKATITNASAAAAKVQIRHKAHNGDLKHIWKTGATEIVGNGTTEQEPIELQVNEGDIIYFEAASASEGTGVIVEWINKLTYIDEFTPEPTPTPTPIPTPEPTPDLNKTVYRASDSWSMEKNGDDVWKWQSYKVTSKIYEDLPNKMEGNLMMGDWNMEAQEETEKYPDGPVWLAGDDWRWSAVGKYTMRATVDPGDPTTEETSGDFKVHRDYPVRTFTSPKNGTVSIQASNNKIWAKDESTGTHIRIMCQRADGSKPIQIFPNADKTDWLNIKGEYNFEPIEFELNAGDKLMFENAFIWKEGGYSPWNTYVQWDPIVEYKTISPRLIGVSPADGAENIALNAEHILNYDGALADVSADKVTVYEVNSEGDNIKSDATCSSIAVDDSAVKFVLDGLKPYTKYVVKIDGIGYSGFDAQNEKSEIVTFTTGPAVNIGEAKYENGKVTVSVNNPYKENKTATLIAAVCKGTESKYSIEKTYYVTRRDIGANDIIETEAYLPSDSDYFIKLVVMEDMKKARAYAPASVIRR